MLLHDLKEALLLAKERERPTLCYLSFSPDGVLTYVRAEHFAELTCRIELHFVERGPLACICQNRDRADIYIHQVLNHDQTPREVISLICKHELLHLQIPPEEKEGEVVQHPPEFWMAEKAICPERMRAWVWIWVNFGACLKKRPRLERIDVLSTWKKFWSQPRMNIEDCSEIVGKIGGEPEEGGW